MVTDAKRPSGSRGDPAPGGGPLQFGDYLLIPGQALYRRSVRVPLAPREMALLELRLGLRGGIATHSGIEKYVWPRQVVSYASVARCIYSVRR